MACINDLVRKAVELKQVDGRFAYIAPQLNQAKDVAHAYLKRYTAPIALKINEAEIWVEVPNAGGHVSRIRIYGADNPDRLRGGFFDGVILDEYADMAPSVWGEIIRPMLADRRGWATFIGTLKGRNHLWKLYEDHADDPDWFTMLARASETGILPAEELADMREDMTPEEYEQEMECNPDAAIRGAYWGKELAQADAAGRMCPVEAAEAPVHRVWDLGVGDSTAIWWWQAVGSEIRVLDFYENHGMGLEHYAAVIASKPWAKGEDWVPHDAKVRELGTGRTRVETMVSLGLKPRLVPGHTVEDGINAVRVLIPRMWFNTPETRDGVEGLKQYRADYDEKLRVFKDKPRHDWCFVGETKVWTHNGMRRIMDLPKTGKVLTPCGWKPYTNPRVTRRDAQLVEVRFSDGLTVKCTPDHLFATDKGWLSAEHLMPGSLILSCSTRSRRISTAVCGVFGQAKNIGRVAAKSFTALSGNLRSGLSRLTAIFTTATATQATTPLATWSAYPPVSIYLSRGTQKQHEAVSISPQRLGPLLQNGTSPMPAGFGTSATRSGRKAGPSGSARIARAFNAGKCFLRLSAKAVLHKSFATLTAKPLIIECVTPVPEREDVWCLTVPDGAAFALSNGAVVHNCSHRADAMRYLAMAYRELVPRAVPEPGRRLAVGGLNTATLEDMWPKPGRERARI